MVVIIRMQTSLFVGSVDCGESVTVCRQKGVIGGCNYRRRSEYVLQQTAAMRQRMDAVDDRRDDCVDASLLSGHQGLTPNSDATVTRLRLDPQLWAWWRQPCAHGWWMHLRHREIVVPVEVRVC
jgi:hypothetical protein